MSRGNAGRLGAVVGVLIVVLIVAGCGGGGDSGTTAATEPSTNAAETGGGGEGGGKSVQLNLGTETVTVEGQPEVGVFLAGSSVVSFVKALKAGVKEVSKETGVPYTLYEAGFDTATQFSQIQDAVQAGKFERIIVQPISSQACKVTKEAMEKGVVVLVLEAALCGQDAKSGDEVWTPGTLASVTGLSTFDNDVKFYESILEHSSGETHALVVTGPEGSGPVEAHAAARAVTLEEAPEFHVEDTIYTDYTAADAYEQIQNYLQGHSDINTIVSTYYESTVGAIKAMEAQGLQGKIKIYESGGGSAISKQEIEAGTLAASASPQPQSLAETGFRTLVEAYEGKKTPHVVPDAGYPKAEWEQLQWITKSTVGSFEPQY